MVFELYVGVGKPIELLLLLLFDAGVGEYSCRPGI